DHGAWVPLRWMYPEADVPVVQLAVQPARGAAHHVELGRALAPLADEDVLIIGSGHTTHNLRDWMMGRQRGDTQSYAGEFAAWLRTALTRGDTDALVHYRDLAPHAVRSHPTEEHFLPLFVAWGAAGERPKIERVVDGIEGGALSMDSYLFLPSRPDAATGRASAFAASN
ncbi:MAG TPA: class III extradiol ring-cleavage dioxygenase, partial [Casimicrobiaceae bacterium]|nr:class III extradiol ring-cleavage dioxygenase [Casimicrobiaceae bacterium]